MVKALLILISILLIAASHSYAVDPFDPFDSAPPTELGTDGEDTRSADELIAEALPLLEDERLLDGRTLLLKALKKDPRSVKAHLFLGGYYLAHVGHFRLAKRYIERALELFREQNGAPPYYDRMVEATHMQLYNLLSQAKLNLDDYQGSLDVLDEFAREGYMASWYASSRAWVLMKLGNIPDAIRVARAGVYIGNEPGRILNMLGILLSMNGQPKEAISILDTAAELEFSLGTEGDPATPLNNMGEVYEEIFDDKNAEKSYLRSLSLPDGCQSVLPALNLAFLYIDQLNFSSAKTTMDNFESCVAQFPLRNGEEHRAFVHLARGRIALLTGHRDEAIEHFESALNKRQWFGKIGTDIKDLEVGTQLSLAEALQAKAAEDASTKHGPVTLIRSYYDRIAIALRTFWLLRETKQLVIEKLNNFEDLNVRNTDAMIEYPTLGTLIRSMPSLVAQSRIEEERTKDARTVAQNYYSLYLAENEIASGQENKGMEKLDAVIANARPTFDDFLSARALAQRAHVLPHDEAAYASTVWLLFRKAPALVRNYGLKLPVRLAPDESWTRSLIQGTPFQASTLERTPFTLSFERKNTGLMVQFFAANANPQRAKAEGEDEDAVMNSLSKSIFSETF